MAMRVCYTLEGGTARKFALPRLTPALAVAETAKQHRESVRESFRGAFSLGPLTVASFVLHSYNQCVY